MPDLAHTLQGHDLGFLRAVASAWGIELQAQDVRRALEALPALMLDQGLVTEVVEALPPAGRQALSELVDQDGRMLWAAFTREFGDVRPMGAARRERERPDLHPASPAEMLWYRGLIGRAFFMGEGAPEEYAYIPDDLLVLLPVFPSASPPPPGRPATPGEAAHSLTASDRILDHACTLLAASRIGMDPSSLVRTAWQPNPAVLGELLQAAGLVDALHRPVPEAAREFLSASRGEALNSLVSAWLHSTKFDELRQLAGLRFEGEWDNDPKRVRAQVLEWIAAVPENTWWNLDSFVSWVKEKHPDFQRPAGDYDSWFILDENNGQYLRGFSSWDAVDGRLLRYLICGPLHWLGIADLAAPQPGADPCAFRLSKWAADLLSEKAPEIDEKEDGRIRVGSDEVIFAPLTLNRAARYQLARFCAWGEETADGYFYRVTPFALERARKQGLKVGQLAALLSRFSSQPVAPALLHALDRWETSGAQASIQEATILRLSSPDILAELRAGPASRYLGEQLSPSAVILKPGGREAVNKALLAMGFLTEGVDPSSR